jgi:hypothetical protein
MLSFRIMDTHKRATFLCPWKNKTVTRLAREVVEVEINLVLRETTSSASKITPTTPPKIEKNTCRNKGRDGRGTEQQEAWGGQNLLNDNPSSISQPLQSSKDKRLTPTSCSTQSLDPPLSNELVSLFLDQFGEEKTMSLFGLGSKYDFLFLSYFCVHGWLSVLHFHCLTYHLWSHISCVFSWDVFMYSCLQVYKPRWPKFTWLGSIRLSELFSFCPNFSSLHFH